MAPVTSLLESLQGCGVLEPDQLEELDSKSLSDSETLSSELSRRGWVTPFKADAIARGRADELGLRPYVLLERIGSGGMGQVFKARHRLMDRIVALKIIRPERFSNSDAVARFHREIQAVARLSHPNIVMAHDAAQVGDTHFFVMEHVEGVDLARLVKENGPLSAGEAVACILQAAQALHHAHQRGIVHRDVKPSNLMLASGDPDRPGGVIKLLDLGLARWSHEPTGALTSSGVVMGTPDFMAPEQGRDSHKADLRSDIYSLGCTLYYLLTGRPPFPGGSLSDKLLRHCEIDPPPVSAHRPDVSTQLQLVLNQMMEKDPDRRYQSAAEVAVALAPILEKGEAIPNVVLKPVPRHDLDDFLSTSDQLDEDDTSPPLTPPKARARRPRHQRAVLVTLAALFVSAVVCSGIIIALQMREGVLTVEVMERDVEVTVEGKSVTISSERLGKIKLQPGKHTLVVKRGDEKLFTKDFVLKWRGHETIRARWERHDPYSLKGLLLATRPSRLADGRSWQVETTFPRAGHGTMALSPQGDFLAHTDNCAIRIYRVPGLSLEAIFHSPSESSQLAWSPDGTRLAVWNPTKWSLAVNVWALQERKRITRIALDKPLRNGKSVAWSGDSTRLAFCRGDDTIAVHDAVTGETLQKISAASSESVTLAWNPKNPVIALGNSDGSLRLWKTDAGEPRLITTKAVGNHFAWNPPGNRLAYLTADKILHVYDITTQQDNKATPGPLPADILVTWTQDGAFPATLDINGKLEVWDSASPKNIASRVAAASNGRQTVARDWYCAVSLEFQRQPKRGFTKLLLKRIGEEVVRASMPLGYYRARCQFSPDGTLLAYTIARGEIDGRIGVLSLGEGRLLWDKGGNWSGLSWNPDGNSLASCYSYSKVYILDPRTGAQRRELQNSPWITCLDWHPGGKQIVGGSDMNQSLEVWDLEQPGPPRKIGRYKDRTVTVSWSRDANWIAAGGHGLSYLWKMPEGNEVPGPDITDAANVAWHPDSRHLAVNQYLWDRETKELRTFVKAATGNAWDHEGRRFFLGEWGMFRVHDLASGKIIHEGRDRDFGLWIAAHPTGNSFVTSGDGCLKFWNVNSRHPEKTIVFLPSGKPAVLGADADLLNPEPDIVPHLVYLRETLSGAVISHTHAQFKEALKTAPDSQ